MISKKRLVGNFIELARTDSLSFAERKAALIVTRHLKSLNLDYFEDDAKTKINGDTGNIICHVKGDRTIPPIAILAHIDTVVPGVNKKPVIDNDIIKTDGTTILGADDHAGVAVIIELLNVLIEDNIKHGDIMVIFTVAEEKGLLGSKNLDFSSIKAKYGFVLDDGGEIGTYTYAAPSQNNIKAIVKGRAAHAGVEPEKGINAISVSANALSRMKLGRINNSTTANIGVINGGLATNIVCDYVELMGEARSFDESMLGRQTEHMKSCFEKAAEKFGAEVDFVSKRMYSSYSVSKKSEITKILAVAAKNANVQLNPVKSGGGSDTNILNNVGITSVNLGIGMRKVHTVDEYIKISDMIKATEFLLEIVKSIR